VVVDPSGNIYVAGFLDRQTTYTFGTKTATGTSTDRNAFLAKYSAAGDVVWVKTTTQGSAIGSEFKSVAVDGAGNIYVAGSMCGQETLAFGSASVNSTLEGCNFLLVKYDSSGNAQWAATNSTRGTSNLSSGDPTGFSAVVADASGNAYVGGLFMGPGPYAFGGHAAPGAVNNISNTAVLVKYDGVGNAKWAMGAAPNSTSASEFDGLGIDGSGNIYAGGTTSLGTCTFGNQSVVGNAGVLVKYDSGGTVLWAKAASLSDSSSVELLGTATDASGNSYVAGYFYGTVTYGPDTLATQPGTDANALIVKYNTSGQAQWARTVTGASSQNWYNGVTVDASGNAYPVGWVGNGTTLFGTEQVVPPANLGNSMLIVKYDKLGTVQWARTLIDATWRSEFYGAAADTAGHVYAVGHMGKSNNAVFSPEVVVSDSYEGEGPPVLVQYKQ
jgi:hypothetical protein